MDEHKNNEWGSRDDNRWQTLTDNARSHAQFAANFSDHVLTHQPDHVDALATSAQYLTTLGYYKAGLARDRALTALRPNNANVLYNLACSLSLTGEIEEALAVLEQAVIRGYRDTKHLLSDRDLDNLKNDHRFFQILQRANTHDDLS